MYSKELREKYLRALEPRLTPKRLRHSLGVEKMAGQLAKEYGEDPQKAEIAGLLHDYAKYIPDEQMLEYAKKFGIALCPAYEEKPNLMHGPVGAKLVEQELGIRDPQILRAIALHTTGAWGMNKLEEILYLADLLEESRDFEGVSQLRKVLKEKGPEETMICALERELEFLQSRGRTIHPNTQGAYEWMKQKKEKQG